MNSMNATDPMHEPSLAGSLIFQSPQKRRLIFCLLLALATISLYSSVFHAPFLNYDDPAYVTENAQVRAGLTWNTVIWAFRTTEVTNWHPVTWLSHALDCQIFGLNPAGPHIVNVLLHAANAVLLFLILASATGLPWRSLAVAALFALHPLNVESVAWIAERKNVLSMFFLLLALAAYGWYARRPGFGRYLAVTLAFALGLMTKPQVITFPFALLLLDYWPLGRLGRNAGQDLAPPNRIGALPSGSTARRYSFWRLVWEKAPWFALSALSAAITMKVQTDATQAKLPLLFHLGNAALAYVEYLGKAFWPRNLALIYPHPELSISIPAAALSALGLMAVTTVAVIFRQHRPYFVGWFWFVGTMVPMIGLVQVGVQAMADRYAYIPLLGIFVIVCWGAAELQAMLRIPKAVAASAVVVLVVALGFGLHRQVGFWSDNLTLWGHTLQITQGNYTAEDNYATALLAQGRVEEAMPHFQRARFFRPDDALATLNLATYEQMRGNYQAAIDGYAKVPQFTNVQSMVALARVNSGYAHYTLKQYASAKQDFAAALSQQPGNSPAYRGLGLLAQKDGNLDQAEKFYRRAVELQPSPEGFLFLAQALELGGQPEAARQAESQAAQMTSDLSDDIATVRHFLAD